MPQQWSKKEERQYQHIKEGLKDRGSKRAEEVAARTVNKERARKGTARQTSKSSAQGSSSRHGGMGSGSGAGGRTKEQLYNEAKKKNIKGRSKMTKSELEKALR
ncbi:MAG TPA: plasmid stabilization protein [Jiangellaceae bacterium]|nr:plasmid stabilization protein [Jiangellaceae bacterium]